VWVTPRRPRDDFVALLVDRSHDDRLDQALRLDRLGQFRQTLIVHMAARLILARLQLFDRKRVQSLAHRLVTRRGHRLANQ
jgi:hypothetical protein